MEIPPWWMLGLDSVVLVVLLVARPNKVISPLRSPRWRWLLIVAVYLLAAVAAGWSMLSYQPALLSGDGIIVGSGNTVVLEPVAWIDKPFPLLEFVETDAELTGGSWRVVLYHHDCPDCQAKLDALRNEATGERILLLEIPPYGSAADDAWTEFTRGRLGDDWDWFVETPVELWLEKGVVREVAGN